jgi:hypothetical protein
MLILVCKEKRIYHYQKYIAGHAALALRPSIPCKFRIMPHTSPVILILGAGSNVGQHVARAFASKGYKVALAARRLKEADNTADQINIPGDLSDPNAVVSAFS